MSDLRAILAAAEKGTLPAVIVIVGEARVLADRAVSTLREATLRGGVPGFNDDAFDGDRLEASRVLDAARTLPMMAQKRWVLVRNVDKAPVAEQNAIAEYIASPAPDACVVLTGKKLDGRGKLSKAAKKAKVLYELKSLKGRDLSAFVQEEARRRGHRMSPAATQTLLDALGDDLGALEGAVEQLSLYVGSGNEIGDGDVEACVTRVRADTVWALVDAVSVKDRARAIAASESLLAARESPIGIVALVSRQLRMVAKMRQALAEGARGEAAAKAAGAPPWKHRDLTEAARRFPLPAQEAAFRTLAAADTRLKGSKRPAEVVLTETLLTLCR